MKIKFLATGSSPDYYSFENEVVTIYQDGKKESIDFSSFEIGDKYEGIEFDTITLPPPYVIRGATRDNNGVLHLTLCQKTQDGNWVESDWMNVEAYDKDTLYIREVENYGDS